MKLIGLLTTIVGIWLGGAGILGQDRLESWEAKLRDWTRLGSLVRNFTRPVAWVSNRLKNAPGKILSTYANKFEKIYPYIFVLALILFTINMSAGAKLFPKEMSPLQLLFDIAIGITFSVVALAAIFYLIPLLFFIVAVLIGLIVWIIIIPYRVLDSIRLRANLQGTLVLVGLVLATVGAVIAFVS